jgi:hypothetical protein
MDSDQTNVSSPSDEAGAWIGRHEAFSLIANRCLAADAECLKALRDSGEYKKYAPSWAQFCEEKLGMSRPTADRQIECFEQFGANYRRMAEAISISPATYELINGSVSDKGLEFRGEYIPIKRENSAKLAAAVKVLRKENRPTKPVEASAESLQKAIDKVTRGIVGLADDPDKRVQALMVVEHANERFQTLTRILRGA